MPDIPVDSLPMEEYKTARTDGKGAGDKVSVADLKENDPEQPTGKEGFEKYKERRETSKSGVQSRIDQLTKRSKAAESENQTLKTRLAELEGKNGNGIGQESSTSEERQDVREEPAARRTADDPRMIAARERFGDYDKVMRSASNVRIADEASKELHESPLAAHVSYFLAKNSDLVSELVKFPPARQVQEIRRMESHLADMEPGAPALAERIVKESSPAEVKALRESVKSNPHLLRAIFNHMQELADLSNGPAVYAALSRDAELAKQIAGLPKSKAAVALGRISGSLERTAEERPRTQAPPPIRPVLGGSTRSTVELDKTNYQDFKRLRTQGRVR